LFLVESAARIESLALSYGISQDLTLFARELLRASDIDRAVLHV
jgi:hypothetical protein